MISDVLLGAGELDLFWNLPAEEETVVPHRGAGKMDRQKKIFSYFLKYLWK